MHRVMKMHNLWRMSDFEVIYMVHACSNCKIPETTGRKVKAGEDEGKKSARCIEKTQLGSALAKS